MHYLKGNNKPLYTTLLMKNELTNHLVLISIEAENRFNTLMEQYKNSNKLLSKKVKQITNFNGQNASITIKILLRKLS